jgi:hypothetical protein
VRRTVVNLAALVILAGTTAHAQVPVGVATAVMPSPLGIALTVGKWIYDATTKEQVYYIEVAGEGRTTEEARKVAFRVAVEQAIGSLLSSETEVQNGRIVRDEIISYASGYIDRFEVTGQEASPIGVRTTMKVWVRRSALSNRLLNRSEKAGEVDGPRASVQLSTLNQERATGDRLVQTVLNDFPKRAFDIELKNTELKYSNARQGVLEVPFKLSWNKDYLSSLWTALDATSQKSSRPTATISVSSGGWFKGFGGTATYDDVGKLHQVIGTTVGSRPAVLITIRSTSNKVLHRQCYRWPELDHFDGYVVRPGRFVSISPYGNTAAINGGFTLDAVAQIPADPGLLANASRVDVDIVTGANCPNR